jgi:hypothetical protein
VYLLQKSKTKASSRSQIDIESVKDGVLTLTNNRNRVFLQVSSLNFELKSEEEQDALIDTYESFINSIGFPLQILIRTREIDMDKYLVELENRLEQETETIYKKQLQNYEEFIRSLIVTNKILTRNFYVIVPHDSSSKSANDIESIKERLNLKVDIISKGFSRLGMHTRQLSSLEILDLFYSFYSPEQSKIQPLTDQALHLINSSYIRTEGYA